MSMLFTAVAITIVTLLPCTFTFVPRIPYFAMSFQGAIGTNAQGSNFWDVGRDLQVQVNIIHNLNAATIRELVHSLACLAIVNEDLGIRADTSKVSDRLKKNTERLVRICCAYLSPEK